MVLRLVLKTMGAVKGLGVGTSFLRNIKWVFSSIGLEHLTVNQKVIGSSPIIPAHNII